MRRRRQWVLGVAAALAGVLVAPATGAPADCHGAAARDPANGCRGDRARTAVAPTPSKAQLSPGEPCTQGEIVGYVVACDFGAPAEEASRHFVLIGDSHAMHWRAAAAQLARTRGWHGISITRSGCPFSFAEKELEPRDRAECNQWKQDVLRWFGAHPEVDLVLAGQLISTIPVVTEPGQDQFDAQVEGFQRAWQALPDSVRDIVVLRDIPRAPRGAAECVRRSMKRGRPAARRCAGPRSELVRRDPALSAAVLLRSGRMHLGDFTRFFCGRRRCWPVVGGVLVFKDGHHMTREFSTSLGPYLGRVVDERGIG